MINYVFPNKLFLIPLGSSTIDDRCITKISRTISSNQLDGDDARSSVSLIRVIEYF